MDLAKLYVSTPTDFSINMLTLIDKLAKVLSAGARESFRGAIANAT